jgi:hypothetical protein
MSLLSANVKDFVQGKDRKMEDKGGSANAGAFILSDAIQSEKEV